MRRRRNVASSLSFYVTFLAFSHLRSLFLVLSISVSLALSLSLSLFLFLSLLTMSFVIKVLVERGSAPRRSSSFRDLKTLLLLYRVRIKWKNKVKKKNTHRHGQKHTYTRRRQKGRMERQKRSLTHGRTPDGFIGSIQRSIHLSLFTV